MKRRTAAILLALALLTGCGGQKAPEYIGAEEAKRLALQACGLAADQAQDLSADMTTEDGRDCYQVELSSDAKEWCYQVDALNGEVSLLWSQDAEDAPADPAPDSAPATDPAGTDDTVPAVPSFGQELSAAPGPSGGQSAPEAVPAAPSGSGTPAPSGGQIPAEEVKALALAHAGLESAEFQTCELDWEDGKQVYEIEFTSDGQAYEYELDAASGTVLKWSVEGGPASSGGPVTAEEAKALALAKVSGASSGDVWDFETDYDDGRTEYEGEIFYNGTDYDFKIDGATGAFLCWEEAPCHHAHHQGRHHHYYHH